MKVGLVSSAYFPYPSGVSEHVFHLACELRARGHSVSILTTDYGARGSADTELGVIRLGRVLMLRGYGSQTTLPTGLRLSGQVKSYLRTHKFDIIHVHGLFPPELGYWALHHAQVPTVVTFHTTGLRPWRLLAPGFRRLFARDLRRLAARIAVSQAARASLEAFVPGEYRIIPNGVDTGRFRPGTRPAVRPNTGPQRILYVGRLDQRKGLPVLLRAFGRLRREGGEAVLVVAGKGPLESRCRRLATELGVADRVDFLGYVAREELPGYYASADACCFPTLGGEAFGIVLLEAMSSGKPVVATDIEGYQEVISNGVNGLLVKPGDPDALASGLNALLGDPTLARRLAENGLLRAQEFSWPRVAGLVEDLYREVLARAQDTRGLQIAEYRLQRSK